MVRGEGASGRVDRVAGAEGVTAYSLTAGSLLRGRGQGSMPGLRRRERRRIGGIISTPLPLGFPGRVHSRQAGRSYAPAVNEMSSWMMEPARLVL